jgi:hypothetical protein
MENGTNKLGFRIAAGFLFGIVIIFAVLASGVQLPTAKAETGTLVVLLTDAPVELDHLNITISNMSVLNVDSDEEKWVDIPFVNDVTEWYTDLLALQNVTEELSVAQIPDGNYTKVRMIVTTANATYTDGTTTDLRVPSGHLDIIVAFRIEAGKTTHLLIDMQADWVAISKSGNLRPIFKATVTEPQG